MAPVFDEEQLGNALAQSEAPADGAVFSIGLFWLA